MLTIISGIIFWTGLTSIEPKSDNTCTVISQGYDLNVTCLCQDITGYQVIFQHSDPKNVLELMVYSSYCSHSVIWNATKNGTYYVTVFPIKAGHGIINSETLHSEEVHIGPVDFSTTVTPLSYLGTNNIIIIVHYALACFF